MEQLFVDIGLEQSTIKNILKNAKLSQALQDLLQQLQVTKSDKKIGNIKINKGNFYYDIISKTPDALQIYRNILGSYVRDQKIDSKEKLDASISYLKTVPSQQQLDLKIFDEKSGVGVQTSEDKVEQAIKKYFEQRKEELLQERYNFNIMEYLATFKKQYPFYNGGVVKTFFDKEVEKILGPKTEEDLVKKVQPKKEVKVAQKTEESDQQNVNEFIKDLSNFSGRLLSSSINNQRHIDEQNKITEGKVMTRFPPEPNGYLHIGHAKAMRFSFQTAKMHKGFTYLRFDDTNPEKENIEYIRNIQENITWLGYQPFKITFASDNFQKIFEFAIQLIKIGKAYVCSQNKEQTKESRQNKTGSPFRNRPIEENLRLFNEMKMGIHEEGSLSLRLKIDPAHDNPTLRDPHIYRIRYTAHPHCGDKWCIYPLYDFTHCICDSLERITHSFCSLEFEIRRDLYYWILEQLDLYRPVVWEYSRLNISNTVLSKRKLHKLIFESHVQGWDDPRIFTLNGLRRRGYTAEAINEFCDSVGVTRRGNENIIPLHFLENILRKQLDNLAPRRLTVLDPVKLTIQNLQNSFKVQAIHFPKNPERGTYEITCSNKLWVERDDVKLQDSNEFFGFAPGKVVGLKYFGVVKVLQVKSENDQATEVICEFLQNTDQKPKSYLHWIAQEDSVDCTVRLYENLFNEYNPNELEDYIKGINKESLITKTTSKMNKNLLSSKIEERYQFERLGFFVLDKDSTNSHKVWNRTVTLQDKEKQKAQKKTN